MEKYKLLKQLDPTVLLCSDKTEFKAFGVTYIEHHLYENRRIVENTLNGRCIEFYSGKTKSPEDMGIRINLLLDMIYHITNTLSIYADEETLFFNTSLTRRKYKIEKIIKWLVQKSLKIKIIIKNKKRI